MGQSNKKFYLTYTLSMVRIRGKQEHKIKSNYIDALAAGVPKEKEESNNPVTGLVGTLVANLTQKKERGKTGRKTRRKRRKSKKSEDESGEEDEEEESSEEEEVDIEEK